jgi:hypothetical protein
MHFAFGVDTVVLILLRHWLAVITEVGAKARYSAGSAYAITNELSKHSMLVSSFD